MCACRGSFSCSSQVRPGARGSAATVSRTCRGSRNFASAFLGAFLQLDDSTGTARARARDQVREPVLLSRAGCPLASANFGGQWAYPETRGRSAPRSERRSLSRFIVSGRRRVTSAGLSQRDYLGSAELYWLPCNRLPARAKRKSAGNLRARARILPRHAAHSLALCRKRRYRVLRLPSPSSRISSCFCILEKELTFTRFFARATEMYGGRGAFSSGNSCSQYFRVSRQARIASANPFTLSHHYSDATMKMPARQSGENARENSAKRSRDTERRHCSSFGMLNNEESSVRTRPDLRLLSFPLAQYRRDICRSVARASSTWASLLATNGLHRVSCTSKKM